MDTEVIRCFLTVARCKSFNRAADELFISASTVSRRIAAMEKELGRPVFRRSSVEIELTDAGLRLLPKAEETLACYEKMLASVQ